jgi:solute carrier family 25 phosphate transporter 3
MMLIDLVPYFSSTMPTIFPNQDTLANTFASRHPLFGFHKEREKPAPPPKQRPLFPAWSAVDDVKHTVEAVGSGASKEFEKASQKVQSKTGKIELYSAKYYASCTFGGLLACVSIGR